MSYYLILFQIFVGNLDSNVTDEHLRQVFSQYGELVHVKIPAGKRCGFVQFSDRLVFSKAFMTPTPLLPIMWCSFAHEFCILFSLILF